MVVHEEELAIFMRRLPALFDKSHIGFHRNGIKKCFWNCCSNKNQLYEGVLNNFAKFTGKNGSLFYNEVAGLGIADCKLIGFYIKCNTGLKWVHQEE